MTMVHAACGLTLAAIAAAHLLHDATHARPISWGWLAALALGLVSAL